MTIDTRSVAEQLAELPEEDRNELLAGMTDAQQAELLTDWAFWGRKSQIVPDDSPSITLMLGGRGSGKTRAGSEFIHRRVRLGKAKRVHLIGRTAGDVRDVLVEGESGLLATAAPGWKPEYQPTRRKLTWPNGAVAITFSAEAADQLRGPQADCLWCDELASWNLVPDAAGSTGWDNAMFGLRLGKDPKALITTTPRPIKLIKDLMAREGRDVLILRSSLYDNALNLAPTFLNEIIARYEGTRLGMQEIYGQILEEVEGALWHTPQLDETRVVVHPHLEHVVVGVDPSISAGGSGDECGIIVAGVSEPQWTDVGGIGQMLPHFYVLDDASLHASPEGWAQAAVAAYSRLQADKIIVEVNQGGAMVTSTLKNADPNVPIDPVRASRGKRTRAEPIAQLYEQGRTHHVGTFPLLEEQMTSWVPGVSDSPDRCFPAGTLIQTPTGERRIEDITIGDLVETRQGPRRVRVAGATSSSAELVSVELSDGRSLVATTNHPVWVDGMGFVDMDALMYGMMLCTWNDRALLSTTTYGSAYARAVTTNPLEISQHGRRHSTEKCGNWNVDRFLSEMSFTTLTATLETTQLRIFNVLHRQNTGTFTLRKERRQKCSPLPQHGTDLMMDANGIARMLNDNGRRLIPSSISALTAVSPSCDESVAGDASSARKSANPKRLTRATTTLTHLARSADHFSRSTSTSDSRLRVVDDAAPCIDFNRCLTARAVSAVPSTALVPRRQSSHAHKNAHRSSTFATTMKNGYALNAAQRSWRGNDRRLFDAAAVASVATPIGSGEVFNLQIDGAHEYFANGVLVHNCDALVWAMTYLLEKVGGGPVNLSGIDTLLDSSSLL